MIKITEDLIVLPLEYGEIPENLNKTLLYKLERRVLRKVKNFNNNKYLLLDIQKKLDKVDCPVTLEILSEMDPFEIIKELLGTRGLKKYYLIDPFKDEKDIEEVNMDKVKEYATYRRNRKKAQEFALAKKKYKALKAKR